MTWSSNFRDSRGENGYKNRAPSGLSRFSVGEIRRLIRFPVSSSCVSGGNNIVFHLLLDQQAVNRIANPLSFGSFRESESESEQTENGRSGWEGES